MSIITRFELVDFVKMKGKLASTVDKQNAYHLVYESSQC